MTLHKATWTDKTHPQTLVRGDVLNKSNGTYWNTLVWTPDEDPTVVGARVMPVVEGYTDFTCQGYTRIPGIRRLDINGKPTDYVVDGSRPLSFAFRFFRQVPPADEADGEDETAVVGPFPVSQRWLDGYYGFVVPTYFQTHADKPVGFQVRIEGGPTSISLTNRILKGWERPA